MATKRIIDLPNEPTPLASDRVAIDGASTRSALLGAGVAAMLGGNAAPPMYGGTGIASYATGDILYASAPDTLSRLAAGASGKVLTANGAGAAPSYQDPPTAATGTVINRRTTPTVTTSGTAHNYTLTGTVTRLRVMLSSVSTNGASVMLLQLGTGGAATTSGYTGTGRVVANAGATTVTNFTTGAGLSGVGSASLAWGGWVEFTLLNASTNTWCWCGTLSLSNGEAASAGAVSLSGPLNYVRLTTVAGTDVFDSGEFSVEYDTPV